MLMCGCDDDRYVTIEEFPAISVGTEFCVECGDLIPCGTGHYQVRGWTTGEYGDEIHLSINTVCEVCGDLAISFLEMGYCWFFGDLRNDIKELHDYEN